MTESAAQLVHDQLHEALDAHRRLVDDRLVVAQVVAWSRKCARAIASGGAALFAGNGGSFADAQHIAAELTGKMGRLRVPLPGIALGTNSSSMSAIGNDFGYDDVFARECRALARPGSVVTALSTSGNSPTVLRLIEEAQDMGLEVIGLSGAHGGKMAELCETIRVPSLRTERIQEMHILLGHTLCLLIEEQLVFGTQPLPGHE